ncbi:MAG TPA: cbb3-type cytochrome c oxidase N-terminal domain-containing protein [Chitinophagaceae bacterium]|nr:cbb3-type cytochrome c oxidase N-terminal domain-containing protein [Chitinophagaceae bacterium]
MLQIIRKKSRNIQRLLVVLLLLVFSQPLWAAGPPAPSIFDNPLALTFITLMIILLIIIGILAYILIGAADLRMKKEKKSKTIPVATPVAASLLTFLLLSSSSLFAQAGGTTGQTVTTTGTIAGLTSATFWIMASVIFLELLIIIVMLFNIRALLKTEREKIAEPVAETAEVIAAKRNRLSWWDRFNKLRPVSQEADLDLGHDYDGIRELNNRLPPWWLYGFYVTIIFAGIYLWRFHVSHDGPSSKEEYERSVAAAELKVNEYLKMKGDNVDENSVVFLSDKSDIDAGRAIFADGPCSTCHGKDGSGMVMGQPAIGPNLTDEYWIHGGNIKNIFTTIKYGVSGKGMQPWESTYSAKQMAQVTSYIKSLQGTKPALAKEKQGELYIEEQAKPATDSLKNINDSLKVKDNKVAVAVN